jgi:hypothetical protein
VRTGAFGKKGNALAFFELAEDLPHCGNIGPAQFYRYGINRGNQGAEKPIVEKRVTGNEVRRSFQRRYAKYRVEITLVIADKYKGALSGDIISAVCAQTKKQDAKYPANPACEPEPSCS